MNKSQPAALLLLLSLLCPNTLLAMGVKSPVRVDNKAPCIPGSDSDRQSQAQQIFVALVAQTLKSDAGKASLPKPDEKITEEFSQETEAHFFHLLSAEMEKHGCAFSEQAKFETVGETIDAIANGSFKIAPNKGIPQWLKPGFRAVLGAYDNNNTIFIETTASGFVFHACEHDTNTPGNDAPPPTEACPTLFNNSLYVPIDDMLKNTNGLQHRVLLVLKELAGASVIVTSDLSFGIVSSVAAAVVNATNPDPVAIMQRDQRVGDATRSFLQLGSYSASLGDKAIITRMLPTKYDDLKQALTDVVGEIFSDEYKNLNAIDKQPNNPNLLLLPAEQIEIDFHARVEKEYNDAKAANAPKQPQSLPASNPN